MSHDRIESLLERIALALEQLVAQTNQRSVFLTYQRQSKTATQEQLETKAHPLEVDSSLDQPICKLEPFLQSKEIRIKTLPPDDPANHVIDRLSLYLGEHYPCPFKSSA